LAGQLLVCKTELNINRDYAHATGGNQKKFCMDIRLLIMRPPRSSYHSSPANVQAAAQLRDAHRDEGS
jgi:hypothetical protein